MKWILILTVVVAVVLIGHAVNFGMYPSAKTHAFGMLILMISSILLCLNFTAIFTLWRQYKALSLLPLLILLGSCAASLPAGSLGSDIRIQRFKNNLSKYEEIVAKVVSSELPNPGLHEIRSDKKQNNYVAFRTPAEYQDLVPYLITADRDGTNTVAVRLVLCVMFPNHHRAYLWCPDGQFEARLREWEHVGRVINPNWCTISD